MERGLLFHIFIGTAYARTRLYPEDADGGFVKRRVIDDDGVAGVEIGGRAFAGMHGQMLMMHDAWELLNASERGGLMTLEFRKGDFEFCLTEDRENESVIKQHCSQC